MRLEYSIIIVVMLFVMLISIQFTLNKILVILREVKDILLIKKNRE